MKKEKEEEKIAAKKIKLAESIAGMEAGMEAAKKELEKIERQEQEAIEEAARIEAAKPKPPIRDVYDAKDAAEYLRVTKSSIYQLVFHRKLATYRPSGKKLYFRKSDLDAYVFRNKQIADGDARELADKILTANMMA